MAADTPMPVRKMKFGFRDDMDLVFIEGDPATSYLFVGAWMMLPHLEPFLIRTVQAALPSVQDAGLRDRMVRFCAQEGQHFRQHSEANEIVKRTHPAGPKLAELEAEVAAEFAAWSRDKPLRFNLAYAEGFESMTCAAARAQIEVDMFAHMKEPIRSLMYWHIVEEIEHRSVCFDVYESVVGDWIYRTRMSLWFQKHYLAWCSRFAGAMIAASPKVMAAYDTAEWRAIRSRRAKAYQRAFLPKHLATFLPWYNPSSVPLPRGYEAARRQFSELAISIQ